MIIEIFLFGLGIGMSAGGAVGVLAGRRLEFHNAYGAGYESRRVMDEYEKQYPGSAHQMEPGVTKAHPPILSYPHYCTRKCFED